MNGKRFSPKKQKRNGLYLALAVCLTAVGIAAWSTYDAVREYLEPAETETVGAQTVSRIPVKEDAFSLAPEKEDPQTLTPTPTPALPTPAPKQKTPAAVRKDPVSTPEPKREEPESSAQLPVNAVPLYERSTELMVPVASKEVLQAYSYGAPVYSKTMRDWRIHIGTDWKAEPEEPVKACGNGIVRAIYTDSKLGNVLVIEHGDYEFSYCGLGEYLPVQEGDVVSKGQEIGAVTAVPMESAEEPHLHLEVRRDEICQDPQTVLEGTH